MCLGRGLHPAAFLASLVHLEVCARISVCGFAQYPSERLSFLELSFRTTGVIRQHLTSRTPTQPIGEACMGRPCEQLLHHSTALPCALGTLPCVPPMQPEFHCQFSNFDTDEWDKF
jgi:hypothetical protein